MKNQTVQHQASSRLWCKPREGWIKINTNDVCMSRTGQMGVGCVIRDEWGYFIQARNKVVRRRL